MSEVEVSGELGIHGTVSVAAGAEVAMAGFDGEDPAWAHAFHAALQGMAAHARNINDSTGLTQRAAEIADEAVAVLDARAESRREVKNARNLEIAKAVAAVGRYASTDKNDERVYYVVRADAARVVLCRSDDEPKIVMSPRDFKTVDDLHAWLLDENYLVPDPANDPSYKHQLTAARVLGIDRVSRVTLVWGGAPREVEDEILDVLVDQKFRPTQGTWAKLIEAGLPLLSYEAAQVTWGDW